MLKSTPNPDTNVNGTALRGEGFNIDPCVIPRDINALICSMAKYEAKLMQSMHLQLCIQ